MVKKNISFSRLSVEFYWLSAMVSCQFWFTLRIAKGHWDHGLLVV